MKYIKSLNLNFIILSIASLFLGIIPFFWLQPGQIDIGGDASRLYFYDPYNYFRNVSFFVLSPEGIGAEYSYQFTLAFVGLLGILKYVISSPYLLITLFNSLSLTTAFLSVYGIVTELLTYHLKNKQTNYIYLAGILSGLFYLFSPPVMGGGWDKALLDHSHVFLNPLMFWFLLKYLHTHKFIYCLFVLIISFIFSPNFSYSSLPKFVSFYSISAVFLCLYSIVILKRRINVIHVATGFIGFILLHLYHIVPWIVGVFNTESTVFYKTFTTSARADAIHFFHSMASYIRTSANFQLIGSSPTEYGPADIFFIIFPIIIVVGAILNQSLIKERKLRKIFVLLSLFFLVTFFFATATITKSTMSFYLLLFYLPGFTMFRNFVGQWMHTYIFYYVILFGFAIFYIQRYLVLPFRLTIYSLITAILLVQGWGFIRGDMINKLLTRSAGVEVRVPIQMNPAYEHVLQYIRNDPIDGKYLSFPIVDHFYQILAGKTGGAYIGPSTISYLTDKKDFGSSQILAPYSDVFLESAKEKDYQTISNILSILNIHSLFYNSDPYVLENFLDFPYQQVRQYLPTTQEEYASFVSRLPFELKNKIGDHFLIYTIRKGLYLPHIYVAKKVRVIPEEIDVLDKYTYIAKSFHEKNTDIRQVFLSESVHADNPSKSQNIKIAFERINPAKYTIRIDNAEAPFILVFSEAYSKNWKLFLGASSIITPMNIYFDGEIVEGNHKVKLLQKNLFETVGKLPVADDTHFLANGYANAWYINPKDLSDQSSFTFILENVSQRLFYILISISLIVFICCVVLVIMLLSSSHRRVKSNNV